VTAVASNNLLPAAPEVEIGNLCRKPDGGWGRMQAKADELRLFAVAPEAARKLIDLAGYLRDGGLDLYSPQALKCSPKLTE